MSDDLIPIGGGELVPSHVPDLQPDVWQVPAPDFITEHQYSDSAPTFFGAPLPDGTSMSQAEQAVNQLTTVFSSDMAQYRFDGWLVDAAVNWFKSNALLPIGPTSPQHNYRLTGYRIPSSDQDSVNSFLNAMSRVNAPQRFVQACLWWINQLGQQQPQQPQHQRQQAVTIDDLTDAEYKFVKERAARDLENSTAILKQRWGDQYAQRMRVVWNHIANLPAAKRDFLESAVTQGGILLANTVECVEALYKEAVGSTVNPNNLAGEIAAIEKTMRENRKLYNDSPNMQERLRVLYGLRDG